MTKLVYALFFVLLPPVLYWTTEDKPAPKKAEKVMEPEEPKVVDIYIQERELKDKKVSFYMWIEAGAGDVTVEGAPANIRMGWCWGSWIYVDADKCTFREMLHIHPYDEEKDAEPWESLKIKFGTTKVEENGRTWTRKDDMHIYIPKGYTYKVRRSVIPLKPTD